MKKAIKVAFKTLTPFWTGDVNGACEEFKLTGIIGSLRWWLESLVRGMGYYACDSTSDNKYNVEIKNPEDISKIPQKICPVCYLFGKTGWKGRFLLTVEDNQLQKLYNGKVVVKINSGRGWHYEAGLMGNAALNFKYGEFYFNDNLKFSDVFQSIIKILLYLIQEYGMLGAKASMGYGVVKFNINGNELSVENSDWENFTNFLALFDKNFKKEVKELPNLKDMFFVKFKVNDNFNNILKNIKPFYRLQDGILEGDIDKWKDSGCLISSPVVRNCLRCIFRGKYSEKECKLLRNCSRNYWWNKRRNQNNNNYNTNKTIDVLNLSKNKLQNIRHFLMGSTQEPEFSTIQVSYIYSNGRNLEFRIYGWLPDKEPINGKVQDILNLLTQLFEDVPWKEKFDNSQRNNIGLLQSQIDGICWLNNNLELLRSKENIKKLFFIQGEYQ